TPFSNEFGDLLQSRGDIRACAGDGLFQSENQVARVCRTMPGRQESPELLIEGEDADGEALEGEKIGEGGSKSCGEVRCGVTERAVVHGAAAISQHVAAKIGFILELFDEEAITAGIHAPIQIPGVIIRRKLAIFSELDGEAVIRAAVKTVPESLDDNP